MMLVCRSAWQRLAPLTQRVALLRNAPVRQMSASSVPGSSGSTLPYYLLLGAAFAAGGAYVYRTLDRDRERLRERYEHSEITKKQFESAKDDGVTAEAQEVSAPIEEAVEAATEETAAEEVTEQEVVPSTSVEEEQAVFEEEASPAPSEEEPAVSAEVSIEQVEQENAEPVVEAIVVENVPVLEDSSDDIVEELASAVEDWSELSARKPEEPVENSPVAQEGEEAVESEAAASS